MPLDLKQIIKAAQGTDKIVTPIIRDWLMQHGDDALDEDVARWVYEQLITKPRERHSSFSASSAGSCLRAQELQFLAMPGQDTIDPRLQNIFNDGKWRHLRWQAMCMMSGALIRAEMPLFWRSKRSRGTIDGLGIVTDDHRRTMWRGLEYGFELKGVNPFIYHRAVKGDPEIKHEHLCQVHRYFLMGGFDLFVVLYENKGTQEWYEWVIEPDDEYMEIARQELDDLNDSIDNQKLSKMLPQCRIGKGAFKECTFGMTSKGACHQSGDWPNLTKKNKKKGP